MGEPGRREFLQAVGLAAAAGTLKGEAPGGKAPNILFILADSYNPNVLGCAGRSVVQTPNLDRLAGGDTGCRALRAPGCVLLCPDLRDALPGSGSAKIASAYADCAGSANYKP